MLVYRHSHVWFVYRFPSLLFVYTTCPTTRLSTTSLCLLHHLTRHSLKSCATAFLSVSFVFPKSFLDPQRLVARLPLFSRGLVSFVRIFIMVELSATVVCKVFFDLPRPVHQSSHPFCHGVRRGARVWRVCMCMYCAGSCIQPKALCTLLHYFYSYHRTIVLVHGALVVRSYVLLTKKE